MKPQRQQTPGMESSGTNLALKRGLRPGRMVSIVLRCIGVVYAALCGVVGVAAALAGLYLAYTAPVHAVLLREALTGSPRPANENGEQILYAITELWIYGFWLTALLILIGWISGNWALGFTGVFWTVFCAVCLYGWALLPAQESELRELIGAPVDSISSAPWMEPALLFGLLALIPGFVLADYYMDKYVF